MLHNDWFCSINHHVKWCFYFLVEHLHTCILTILAIVIDFKSCFFMRKLLSLFIWQYFILKNIFSMNLEAFFRRSSKHLCSKHCKNVNCYKKWVCKYQKIINTCIMYSLLSCCHEIFLFSNFYIAWPKENPKIWTQTCF
jgi:hypothetical protein